MPVSSSPTIALLDYGSGNIRSAYRALTSTGAKVVITADPREVRRSDALVVPGVGAFAACMAGLMNIDGERIIDDALAAGKYVLGICVGMQILFTEGREHGEQTRGLGLFPGKVERLHAPILPHMGWNTLQPDHASVLTQGITAQDRFYFVHSYGVRIAAGNQFTGDTVISTSSHGEEFIAIIEKEGLCAAQFHPEKSGAPGLKLLANWVRALD